MKKKPNAITSKTRRRGRKPGDGALKQIDPQASAWSKGMTFLYGRAAECPAFKLVRKINSLIELGSGLKKPGVDLYRELAEALTEAKVALQTALCKGEADLFRKFADAIEGVNKHKHAPVYPLHSAICVYAACATRLTIGELCANLERHGQRPSGQTDEDWQRRVRTVCKEVGFHPLPDKPGPKRKRS